VGQAFSLSNDVKALTPEGASSLIGGMSRCSLIVDTRN
jgi:hypothetical protein